jgi:mycothiol system anti-sigma-R factor
MIMLDSRRMPGSTSGPCEDIVERAHAWLDGELTGDGATALRAHLAGCPPCRQAVEAEERFVGALRRRSLMDAAPDTLRDRVRAMLGAKG